MRTITTIKTLLCVLYWALTAITSVVLVAIGPVVLIPALLATSKSKNELPIWAWPWDNNDPLGDGINGYYKWKELFDGSKWYRPMYNTFMPRYIWLGFRNPLNRFSYRVLGAKIDAEPELVYEKVAYQYSEVAHTSANPNAVPTKISNKDRSGFRLTVIKVNKRVYFELYIVYNYIKGKCMRVRLGYKLNSFLEIDYPDTVQEVMVINPFASYSGVIKR